MSANEAVETEVWMCGGGRQSCAIAALIASGRLEKPSISVIVDTGRERFTTFPYLKTHVIPSLAAIGVHLEIIKAAQWSYYGTGYVDGSGDLMLPAYTREDGVDGKNTPDCSGAWKRDAANRWLSQVHGITRSKYIKWIGFSRSPKEMVRAFKMSNSKKEGDGKTRFPLIELGLTTQDCLRIVEQMGWPEPKVSACWMCPNLKDGERQQLSDEEKQMAITFDEEVRAQFPDTYLHRTFQPLREVDLTKQQDLFDRPCDSGVCFV
jgi:hypothetical protein